MNMARVIAAKPTTEVFTVSADRTVREAVEILASRRIGALPVVDGDALVGIFSERDLVYRAAKEGSAALDRPVREVMTRDPVTATSDVSVIEILALMTRRRIRHVPILAEGRLSGFVSIGDLVKFRIDSIEAEAAAMRTYIQGA